MSEITTVLLPVNLRPYSGGIMIKTNDVWDKSLVDYSDWTQVEEGSVYPYLYKYVYSINTGSQLWSLGSQYKLIFTTE